LVSHQGTRRGETIPGGLEGERRESRGGRRGRRGRRREKEGRREEEEGRTYIVLQQGSLAQPGEPGGVRQSRVDSVTLMGEGERRERAICLQLSHIRLWGKHSAWRRLEEGREEGGGGRRERGGGRRTEDGGQWKEEGGGRREEGGGRGLPGL
jgi:hypothetical protein